MARPKKKESLEIFAEGYRSLAQSTVPRVEDPGMEKLYYEQAERMLLDSF